MKKGIIKKYNPVKGYGFIQAEEDMKKDIFFHCTQLCGASIKIGPGKMGKDILNKTGKRGILDIVTGCPG